MATTTYKKIIVIDINLDWNCYPQEDRRYKELPLVFDLIKKASKYQTLVISTSGCLSDAQDWLNRQNINIGYLIASGGSIIYDIAKKEIIQVNILDHDDILSIVHHGIMHGINVSIYTLDRKFMYISNAVSYNGIKNICYSQHEIIETYDLLLKTLQRTDIVDIGYLHYIGSINNDKQNRLLNNLDKYWEDEICNVIVKTNNTSKYIHFGTKNSTKLNAIQKIMSLNDIEHLSDVLYIASSCVNNQCFVTFPNALVAANADFINEIGNKKPTISISEGIEKLDPEFGLKTNSFWK